MTTVYLGMLFPLILSLLSVGLMLYVLTKFARDLWSSIGMKKQALAERRKLPDRKYQSATT